MNNTKVIVIGTSHHNTYSMLRCFGENGVKPILVLYGSSDSYILKSVYMNEHYAVEEIEDVLQILEAKSKEWCGNVIITCSDAIASALDCSYLHNSKSYKFFNCGKEGQLTAYMNKLLQTQLARNVGLDVPESVEGFPSEVEENDITYPRIIKPVASIHGGKQISICSNDADFRINLKLFNINEKIIVQQFIQKEYEIVILGLAVGEQIIIPGFIHKHRESKGGTTFSTVNSSNTLPANILDLCKVLVSKLQYEGLFGIEMIKQGDKYFFVEINLRNDATTYALAIAGANLPLMYYANYNNRNSIIITPDVRSINAIVEFEDFNWVLKRKVNLFTWAKQYKSSECKYFYNRKDSKIFRYKVRQYVYFLLRRLFI